MKITIHAKNYNVGNKLRGIIEEKLGRLKKFIDTGAECSVTIASQGNVDEMSVTITSKGQTYRTRVEGDNMFANVDACLDKLKRQIAT